MNLKFDYLGDASVGTRHLCHDSDPGTRAPRRCPWVEDGRGGGGRRAHALRSAAAFSSGDGSIAAGGVRPTPGKTKTLRRATDKRTSQTFSYFSPPLAEVTR